MRYLMLALLVFLAPSIATAVIDPEPNSIGIYFDQEANINAIDVEPWDIDGNTGGPFEVYIIITNMTELYLDAFAVSYRLVVPEGQEHSLFPYGFQIYGWMGCWFDPPWRGLLSGEIPVGFAQPRYAASALPMVRWTFFLLDEIWIEFFLGPSLYPAFGLTVPYYQGPGGDLIPLNISSGSPDLPVARVNRPAPVSVETASFGSVKALYR